MSSGVLHVFWALEDETVPCSCIKSAPLQMSGLSYPLRGGSLVSKEQVVAIRMSRPRGSGRKPNATQTVRLPASSVYPYEWRRGSVLWNDCTHSVRSQNKASNLQSHRHTNLKSHTSGYVRKRSLSLISIYTLGVHGMKYMFLNNVYPQFPLR
jgi:hypothetical protein